MITRNGVDPILAAKGLTISTKLAQSSTVQYLFIADISQSYLMDPTQKQPGKPVRRSARVQLLHDSATAGQAHVQDLKTIVIALTDEASRTQQILANNSKQIAESNRRIQALTEECYVWRERCNSLVQDRDNWQKHAIALQERLVMRDEGQSQGTPESHSARKRLRPIIVPKN